MDKKGTLVELHTKGRKGRTTARDAQQVPSSHRFAECSNADFRPEITSIRNPLEPTKPRYLHNFATFRDN